MVRSLPLAYLHKYVYISRMYFTWDETKRQANRHQHGLDFAEAPAVFAGPTFTFEDDRFAYEEQRFITLGLVQDQVVVIAHTERGEETRIISIRKGTKREQTLYFRHLTHGLGTP